MDVLRYFPLDGEVLEVKPYGNGHINDTYLVSTSRKRYILQRVNDRIFTDVDALMRNMLLVTDYLAQRDPDPRHVLRPLRTKDGAPYVRASDGCWRVVPFIEGSVCLEKAESAEDFETSAVAFGDFQNRLKDFPAEELTETIPHFHDTPDRFRLFHEALSQNPLGRAKDAEAEIAFALRRETEAGRLMGMLGRRELPLRVTHNDTKLNNVLLDAQTRRPLCVIDLDTVMPGLAAFDFGDSIRFGASTAAEDERDLSRVHLDVDLFRAYARGFLSSCGKSLTQSERDTLALGAWTITLENGVRFLTDHLLGDTYFKIHRENHNLDRCRTQFKLAAEMEEKMDDLNEIVRKTFESLS